MRESTVFWAALVVAGVLCATHPFVYTHLSIPEPYVISLDPTKGPWAQAILGVLIWAPTAAVLVFGLREAWRFSSKIRRAFDAAPVGRDGGGPQIRELVLGVHTWFFNTLQRAFLMWGIVCGLGLLLIVVAREEWWIRISSSVVLALLLAFLFLRPLVDVAVWTARESAALRDGIEEELTERRTQVIEMSLQGESPRASNGEDRSSLRDALDSLPPGNPGTLLWSESLQSFVGLTGPFLSVLYKLLNLVRI